ncbi:MAG: RidA family protein, partial [Christiangramia sp.]|nr:RidA family protein [Christiangramia sp.]
MRRLIFLLLFVTGPVWAQTPEERIKELGIELPEVRQPSANFVKWRQVGNLLFLAGEGSPEKGTLGKDLSTEEGYEAARNTGIRILAT